MKHRWSSLDVEVLERSVCGYSVLFRDSLAPARCIQTYAFVSPLLWLDSIIAVSNKEGIQWHFTHSRGFSFHLPPFKLLTKWIQLFSCHDFTPRTPYHPHASPQYLSICFYNWDKVSDFTGLSEPHPGWDWKFLLTMGNKRMCEDEVIWGNVREQRVWGRSEHCL